MKKFLIFAVILLVISSGLLALNLTRNEKPQIRKIGSQELSIEFKSFSTEISSHQRFQFADLRQVEKIEQTSKKKVLWDTLELPDIVVEVEVPVNYTYFVDLKKHWQFQLVGDTLKVVCPEIEYNPPAAEISDLKLSTKKGSVFRNEEAARMQVQSKLTQLLEIKANENIRLIRETGRAEIKSFVHNWLSSNFAIDEDLEVDIRFQDEDSDIGFD